MERRSQTIRPANKNPINLILDRIKERESVLLQDIRRVDPTYETGAPPRKLKRGSSLLKVTASSSPDKPDINQLSKGNFVKNEEVSFLSLYIFLHS